MEPKHDSLNNISQTPDTEKYSAKKSWTAPHLRVLPVPAKTQSGKTLHAKPPLESKIYRKS